MQLSFKKIATIACLGMSMLFIQHLNAQLPLSVQGNKILAGGSVASFAGNSMFWCNNGWGGEKYYNASCIGWLKSDWKSTIVRAAMGVDESGGYLSDPAGNRAKVVTVVNAAIANGMYVIIDWHSHHAENYQSQAISFFQDMARTFGNTPNVIYEIYNEPLQISWSGTVKPYAVAVISAIRAIDPDNLIIVGTPTWSQDVDVASTDRITGYSNIAYTLHFYAASHKDYLRSKAQTALNNGIALFVTEWGTCDASGAGSVDVGSTNDWVSFMKQNNISNCNWSINDKAEAASALNPGASATGGWSAANLSQSGSLVKGIISGWSPAPPTCNAVSTNTNIEAENYCNMAGIQIENCSEGGQNVGWIDAGDWMVYKVNVASAGTYKAEFRVASLNGGGNFSLKKDATVLGSTSVSATGGWQTWTTVSFNVSLSAGEQYLTIATNTGGFNINLWKLTSGTAPGYNVTLEAENYNQKSTAPKSETCSEGGLNMGWIGNGDWFTYPVTIPASATYTVTYRIASAGSGGKIQLDKDAGATTLGSVSFIGTGGWQTWTNVSHNVYLPAGTYNLGLNAVIGGFNINWINIRSMAASSRITTSTTNVPDKEIKLFPNPVVDFLKIENANEGSTVQVIELSGKVVLQKVLDSENSSINVENIRSGMYILRITKGEETYSTKLIKR